MKVTKSMRFLLLALAAAMVFSLFSCTDEEVFEGSDTTTESATESGTEGTTAPIGGETTTGAEGNQTSTPEGGETGTPESSDTNAPESSDTNAPESSDTNAPESSDTNAPESSDTNAPESSDTNAPESSDTNAPESSDTNAPESSDTNAPESSDTNAPESSDTNAPESSDTNAPESSDTNAPETQCQHEECTEYDESAPTCEADGNEAYKVCVDCGAIIGANGEVLDSIPVIGATGHVDLTDVPAKTATCVAKGNEAYKTCACGAILAADGVTVLNAIPEIPVDADAHDWDEGVVTTDPTCAEVGVRTKTCTRHDCGETTEVEEPINPENHVEGTKVVKCVVVCAGCETPVEGAEKQHGELKTDKSGDAICKVCTDNLGPAESVYGANGFDAYFGGQYFADNKLGTANSDGSARFAGTGSAWEVFDTFYRNEANDKPLGKYLVIKYKTNITNSNYGNIQVYAGTDTVQATEITPKYMQMVKDGEWHIGVLDLANATYSAVEGKYYPIFLRLDLVDPVKVPAGGNETDAYKKLSADEWVDIAFIALCDDPADIAAYMAANEDEAEYCDHNLKLVSASCVEYCAGCGETYEEKHVTTESYSDSEETNVRTYTATCKNCHETIYTYDVQMGAEKPNFFVPASSLAQMRDPFQMGGATLAADGSYVTFKNDTAASANGGEGYFFAIKNGDATAPTGQYMIIKYRTTYNASWEVFIGANNGNTSAKGGIDNFTIAAQNNGINNGVVADGEWHFVIIDIATMAKKAGWDKGFLPEDGTTDTYLVDYMRFDIFNTKSAENQTVDVAYVAFADDLQKLVDVVDTDYYIYCDSYSGGTVGYPTNTETGNPYFSASLIGKKAGLSVLKDENNGNMPFVQFHPAAGDGEKTMMLWENTTYKLPNGGSYVGMLYRVNGRTDNDWFDFFINSTNTSAQGGFSKAVDPTIYGGNWRFGLADLSSIISKAGTDADVYYDPATGIASIRFDFSNRGGRGENVYIDVAFISFFNTKDEAIAYFAEYAQTYLAENTCKHDFLGDWEYIDDGNPDTDKAMQGAPCLICGKSGAVTRVTPVGTTIEAVYGAEDYKNPSEGASLGDAFGSDKVYTFKTGANFYPEGGVKAKADGTIAVQGWAGCEGDATLVYRVIDAEGDASDWVAVTDTSVWNAEGGVNDALKNKGICVDCVGKRFNVTIDLSSYDNQTVTVVLALVAADAPEGSGDKYVYFLQIEGVKVNAEEVVVVADPNFVLGTAALMKQTEGTGTNCVLNETDNCVTYSRIADSSDNYRYMIYPPASINVPTGTTGQYIMIKYRTESDHSWRMHIGANNGSTTAQGGKDSFSIAKKNGTNGGIICDGEWQYLVIDTATFLKEWGGVLPENGTEDVYSIDYMRIGFFSASENTDKTVDVAYIAFAETLEQLEVYGGMDSYTLLNGYVSGTGVLNETVTVGAAE